MNRASNILASRVHKLASGVHGEIEKGYKDGPGAFPIGYTFAT